MKTPFLVSVIVLGARVASAAPGDTVNQATQRGIGYVLPDATQFGITEGCVACHHQGGTLFGVSSAKAANFTVDMTTALGLPALAAQVANDQFSDGHWDINGGQTNAKTSYSFFGLAGYDAYVATTYSNNLVKAADYALTAQAGGGQWYEDHGSLPTTFGDVASTARYMVGMAQAKERVDPSKAAAYQASLDAATAYIVAHSSDTDLVTGVGYNFELAWALIGLKANDVPDDDVAVVAMVDALRGAQGVTGPTTVGWG